MSVRARDVCPPQQESAARVELIARLCLGGRVRDDLSRLLDGSIAKVASVLLLRSDV